MQDDLRAPFPYFGGKSTVADIIWAALGDVAHYLEPFAGSAAVMLARPHVPRMETLNDADHYIVNFWRAIAADPHGVARYSDAPVFEADLSAKHSWLLNQPEWHQRMITDPHYYDAQIAGWWVWGISCWIGQGWCREGSKPLGARPHLTHRMGVHALSHLAGTGKGINGQGLRGSLLALLSGLQDRLRYVRICCGDWQRICTPAVLNATPGTVGIFLDPPYSHALRNASLYSVETDCAAAVADWARSIAHRPQTRIVLAGYAGEHAMPGWRCVHWKAQGGYGMQGHSRGRENREKEALWLSPQCEESQLPLFPPE